MAVKPPVSSLSLGVPIAWRMSVAGGKLPPRACVSVSLWPGVCNEAGKCGTPSLWSMSEQASPVLVPGSPCVPVFFFPAFFSLSSCFCLYRSVSLLCLSLLLSLSLVYVSVSFCLSFTSVYLYLVCFYISVSSSFLLRSLSLSLRLLSYLCMSISIFLCFLSCLCLSPCHRPPPGVYPAPPRCSRKEGLTDGLCWERPRGRHFSLSWLLLPAPTLRAFRTVALDWGLLYHLCLTLSGFTNQPVSQTPGRGSRVL